MRPLVLIGASLLLLMLVMLALLWYGLRAGWQHQSVFRDDEEVVRGTDRRNGGTVPREADQLRRDAGRSTYG